MDKMPWSLAINYHLPNREWKQCVFKLPNNEDNQYTIQCGVVITMSFFSIILTIDINSVYIE